MTRARVLIGAGLLLTLVPLAVASARPRQRSRPPARLLVYAQEWSLWPSRQALPAGQVLVQLDNRGQDAHDLRIQRLRAGRTVGRAQAVTVTRSGAIGGGTWRLNPGRYELYCSMPGHRAAGMHTTLVVRSRRG